jgi:hypothetical protein
MGYLQNIRDEEKGGIFYVFCRQLINIPEPLVPPDSTLSELKKVMNFVITVMKVLQ